MESMPHHSPLTSADNLAWINARVSEDASLTRHRLAKEVCVRLDLRDAKGRPREMACRKQLLVLQRRGPIPPPPPRHNAPRRPPPPTPPLPRPPVPCPPARLGAGILLPRRRATAARPHP